jgi:hypothetical protein
MKRAGNFLLCLAGGVACHVFARAAGDALPDNPYALVVTRNVFGLNPPVPVVTATAPTDPPPKITPNGILSIFGHTQVLFKAAVARPGQAAKDESYNLSEGQSEDDIEVVRIDEKNGIVTFNNHGTVQELPLIAGAASGGEPPAAAGPVNMQGGVPMPGVMPNGGNGLASPLGGGGALGGRNPNLGNGGNYPSASGGPNFGGNSYSGNSGQPSQEAISPEVQVIMMEKNRIDTQDAVNQGKMPPLPPTPLTPDDAMGNNGQPLVQLPPIPGR